MAQELYARRCRVKIKLNNHYPPKYKLRIQLIPESSWYYNLRSVLPKDEWNKLRKKVYAYFGYSCATCRSSGELHAHEVWKFDARKERQSLRRIVALCENCHSVEHFGRTMMVSPVYVSRITKHALKIFKCTPLQFQKKVDKAFAVWQQRNLHVWKVDFGPYANFVKEKGNATKS